MVELLISSDIAKYCEFKTVTRILTLLNGELEKVLMKCSFLSQFINELCPGKRLLDTSLCVVLYPTKRHLTLYQMTKYRGNLLKRGPQGP